ncbi:MULTISPECIES: ammonia permease [Bacillus cereus group]|uniref:ammonia permease n=1 Tax=Bacillus cereus group TaxID=86661 RepID=UPI001C027658|nr:MULTISPECIES: ammonia permease [Bacillus cereus group]QWI51493.1 ammonia permease [Bacillus mycoides]WJE23794.1 ammonia permease [Bacillus cereus]
MESTGLFIWLILAPILLLCEFIVGIFLIVAGIKYRIFFTFIAGLICILLIVVPIICIGYGIDIEQMIPISGTLYWCLFSLAGLLAIISGRQLTHIRSMGIILFISGLCSLTAYHLLYLTT